MLPSTSLTGEAAVMVKIRAYNASGELYTESGRIIRIGSFTLGTRVLLTCNVTGLPEGSEVISYKWHHRCPQMECMIQEVQEGTPYYRVVNDTLLVDVTSQDMGGRYYCDAEYGNEQSRIGFTSGITVTG